MTAFEMASTIARTNCIRTFKRDVIKLAHNKAVEILVSFCLLSSVICRKPKTTVRQISSFASRRACSRNLAHPTQTRSTRFTSNPSPHSCSTSQPPSHLSRLRNSRSLCRRPRPPSRKSRRSNQNLRLSANRQRTLKTNQRPSALRKSKTCD